MATHIAWCSRAMRFRSLCWDEEVAKVRVTRNAYRILVGNLLEI